MKTMQELYDTGLDADEIGELTKEYYDELDREEQPIK